MKVLGIKTVKVAKLKLPGDMRSRMESDRITHGLSESVEEFGIMSEPMVRWEDKLVIYGRDRIAAAMLLEMEEIQVKAVEASDAECYRMELTENARRRHEPELRKKALEELVEQYVEEEKVREVLGTEEKPARGRPSTPESRAAKRLAAETGLKASSVRRAMKRKEGAAAAKEKAKEAPVEDLGMELDKKWCKNVRSVQEGAADVLSRLTGARAIMTKMEKLDRLPGQQLSVTKETLITVISELRDWLVPTTLCPYCKDIEPYTEDCTACRGAGWVGAGVMSGAVPLDLVDPTDPQILVQGERINVGDIFED